MNFVFQSTFQPQRHLKFWTVSFVVLLMLSGITAFFPVWGIDLLADIRLTEWFGVQDFVLQSQEAIHSSADNYPMLFYGWDWLAYAHVIIGLFFIPVVTNPIRYKGVVIIGLVACITVFPMAFIAGAVRQIPFTWQLVDCSFGFFGGLLLLHILRVINRMEKASAI